MLLNIGNQNKTLADAAKTPKDTSQRTVTSNKYAAKVASRKNVSSGTDSSAMASVGHEQRSEIRSSDKIKGSYEGLDRSSRADIQMNDSGYLNKNFQTARNNQKYASHNSLKTSESSFTKSNFLDIMNNMSGVSKTGSSSSLIQQMNRKNNLI
jgi:hypothetical protein